MSGFSNRSTGLRTRLAENRKLLRTLTVDNPSQQRRLDVVDPLIDRRLADLTHISNVRKDKRSCRRRWRHCRKPAAVERMAEIRNLLTAMEDEERTLLSRAGAAAQAGACRTPIGSFCTGICWVLHWRPSSGSRRTFPSRARLGEFQQFVTSVGSRGFDPEIRPRGR